MIRRTPRSTRTDTLFPYTTLFRSLQVFEGPLLADLLIFVGAHGETLRAAALNDYEVNIPIADTDDYPALLALRQNVAPIAVRDKGPVWIIYPTPHPDTATSSEARRVGKECGSTGRTR